MPIYEYKCVQCGLHFERFQHFSDAPLQECPDCNGQVRRVLQPVGIVFKGSGFYSTDNRKTSSPGAPDSNHKDANGKERAERSEETKTATEKVASTRTEK
ncbi:MAG: zinc ribbon domain-containing protein [Anaerolineae bacterium]|nr:zinc ribbon domain-containing protein [Anaerolineae bacterium]MDW8070055.1 FmdB family zinc ribbon protein [Anaerolineae bacterium]